MRFNVWFYLFAVCASGFLSTANAGGSSVVKIENPYVQQLEHEFEYEGLFFETSEDQLTSQRHRVEYGQALTDRWLIELGITAQELENDNLEIESFEIEAKYQITEQGEYNNDWGLIIELEKENSENDWELGASLIAVHQWQNWVGTANLNLEYEFGSDTDKELEPSLFSQFKYRYKPQLEPAIEVFADQDGASLGAALTGQVRLKNAKKIYWETAFFSGLSSDHADFGLRVNLEYEFY